MDMNSLLLSFAFGMVGLGMFLYGRKAGEMVPLLSGAGLMIVPCFIPNFIALLIVCIVLTILPWLVRAA